MASRTLEVLEQILAKSDYQEFLDLLDTMNETMGNQRFGLFKTDTFEPYLGEVFDLSEQSINYKLEYRYKGSTDSSVMANTRASFEGTIGDKITTSAKTKGRVCLCINQNRLAYIGTKWLTDTGIEFYGIATMGMQCYLYYADENGNTQRIPSVNNTIFSTETAYTGTDGTTRTGDVDCIYPSSQLGTGNATRTSCNDGQLLESKFIFECNIPIFLTIEDAVEYVQTGDLTKCINNDDNQVGDRTNTWFIHNNIYNIRYGTKEELEDYNYKWRTEKGRLALYLHEAEGMYNLRLKYTGKDLYEAVGTSFFDYGDFEKVTAPTQLDYAKGEFSPYLGMLGTNIPIFGNEYDADEYLRTGNMSNAINKNSGGKTNLTGNPYDGLGGLSEVATKGTTIYDLDNSNATQLMNYLHTDTNLQTLGGNLWGTNIANGIIDFYNPTLKPSIFGYESAMSTVIQIGNVGLTVSGNKCAKAVKLISEPVVSVDLLGTHGDWRDYECTSYQLYLPFVGYQEIPSAWINHNLQIKLGGSLLTHSITYIVYIDGIAVARYDGVHGVEMPFMAEDFVGKAREMTGGIVGGITSLMQIGGSVATANPTGAISGAVNLANSIVQMERKPSFATQGQINVNNNVLDSFSIYFIIDEQLTIEPVNLHDYWNYPSYTIATLNNFKGYTEIADIKLKGLTSYSDDEINELKSILKSGVIL